MCSSYWQGVYENKYECSKRKLVWLHQGEGLTFYKSYGKTDCQGCTKWCLKHCYMNIKEFLKNKREFLENTFDIPFYDYREHHDELPFHKDIERAKYITFFGSGTINCNADKESIKGIISRYPDKIYRIFTRNLYGVKDFYDHQIIFSVDNSTSPALLAEVISNKNVNIAVLNHPDNIELIDELKGKIKVHISCDDCMRDGVTKHLCFQENMNRSLLIENYEEINQRGDKNV